MLNFIRSILFYVGYALGVLVFGIIALLVAPVIPAEKRYYILTRFNFLVIYWARLTCGIRFEIEGQENMPERPMIVLCNHESAWETYMLGILFSPQSPVLKKELMAIPVFGWVLKYVEPIAIDRGKPATALKQMIIQGKEKLGAGRWVVIYPQGTRVRPGQEAKFNKGGAMLAKQSGYDVLLVAHNAGRCWPAGAVSKRPGVITVRIGPCLKAGELSRDEIHDQAEQWIRAQLQSWSG